MRPDLRLSRLTIWIAVAAAAAIFITVYTLLDPAVNPFPRCIFKSLTGLDCPGCGSQRAIHSLLNGDIGAAWRYNALLVASIPLLVLLFAAAAMRTRRPRLYNALNGRVLTTAVLIVIILWWIVRNTPLLPWDTPA